MAKKSARSTSTRKPKRSWNVYIRRTLNGVNKSLTLSGRSMKIVNSYVQDLFERIAVESAALARSTKKRTLGSREVQTAVRLVLPAELAKHAMAEATRAVAKASA